MKRFSVIILCFLVLYAGVAWALERCLHHDDHVVHGAALSSKPHLGDTQFADIFNSPDHSAARLHCLDLRYQIELTPETFPTQRREFLGSVSVQGSPYLALLRSSETRDFGLRTLFAHSSSSPLPSGLERHIFLSVFLI